MTTTYIALIGCGFVADYYMATIDAYPELEISGVYDKNPKRLKAFSEYYKLNTYSSIEDLLSDKKISIVLNLTDPRSHYTISKQCLQAGKHVYSEKPLAMNFEDAEDLVKLAKETNLHISSAPCSVLGKSAKTLAHAVRNKMCGDIKLVYAELDDGMVHKMAYKKWFSESGAPWPYRDEFEVGCTLEHAGYYLAWLMVMFGPVRSVTAFSDCVVPEKIGDEEPLQPFDTADISFGLLKFESGVVARLSTTIVAPHDHSIRIFCDNGVIYMDECWDNDDEVYLKKMVRIRRKTFLSPIKKKVKLPNEVKVNKVDRGNTKMDFLLGVQDLATAINTGKRNQLSADFSLHVNEVALALQYAGTQSSTYITKSRF
ncbi:Gfo/Idh/MocA family protein [Agarilytica rhodophyticola]|uniref:Gfo/Idh/MocA family protein n=1 Tax=Agarilytica rhodophyticola TaxID=1737490 RepID=UPI000B346578|nr:Gfo/Idh/MocA family oxidoreductase [Agarilytica rhodophyticola]